MKNKNINREGETLAAKFVALNVSTVMVATISVQYAVETTLAVRGTISSEQKLRSGYKHGV